VKIEDLDNLIVNFSDYEINQFVHSGILGIEKENLRIYKDELSLKKHPLSLGSALCSKYITTDFSEAQIELITPPFEHHSSALEFLDRLNEFLSKNIGNELLWCFSMPPYIKNENMIPISNYGTSNLARFKMTYRNGLSHRYGKLMQTISGIHYNYSFPEKFWNLFLSEDNRIDQKEFKSSYYFRALRNIKRFNWLILYLFGASPVVTKNFIEKSNIKFNSFGDFYYLPYATSLRMSRVGYQNKKRSKLTFSSNSLKEFIYDLEKATNTESKAFLDIYKSSGDLGTQLNANLLQIEDEYYEIARPKSSLENHQRLSNKLKTNGVNYIELRSIDLNPFCSHGIDIESTQFIEALIVYSGLKASPPISPRELQEIKNNDSLVALEGRRPDLILERKGKKISLKEWAYSTLDEIEPIAKKLGVAQETIDKFSSMIQQPESTLSGRIINELLEQYKSYENMGNYYSSLHKDHYSDLDEEQNPYWTDFVKEAQDSSGKQKEIEQDENQSFDEFLKDYYLGNS